MYFCIFFSHFQNISSLSNRLSNNVLNFQKCPHFQNVSKIPKASLKLVLTKIEIHTPTLLNSFLSVTTIPLIPPCLAHSCSESPPHRFWGVVPPAPLRVSGVACAWGMGAAVFADVSWLSYVHPAVLAEGLAAVWQLRQGASWEQTGTHDMMIRISILFYRS